MYNNRKNEDKSKSLSLPDLCGLFAIYYLLLIITFILTVLHVKCPNFVKANLNETSVARSASNLSTNVVEELFDEKIDKSKIEERHATKLDIDTIISCTHTLIPSK